jgi:hypothetical protein
MAEEDAFIMANLHLKRAIACASCQAPDHLERWFAEHAHGDVYEFTLRTSPAGNLGIALARDCVVHISRMVVSGSMVPQYSVRWESAGGGPFPKFQGTLSVLNDEDYDSCFLALDGTYEPPFGVAGIAFDQALGHEIAESCGNELLKQIGTYIEQRYRAVEAEKASRRAAETSGSGIGRNSG